MQWQVVWLEPRTDRGARLAPPGLSRLPGPGEAVVSPGLAARGIDAKALGFRPSSAGLGQNGTIGVEGLTSMSEGRVYAVPAPGRTLGSGGALIPVSGFGGGMTMEADSDLPTLEDARWGALLLLVLPALYLIVSGARAVSPIRAERAQVMFRVGIARWRIRMALALETAFLALGGAIGALCLWFAVLSHTTSWPFVGARLLPGGLPLSSWAAATIALLAVVTAVAAGSAVRIPARSVRGGSAARWPMSGTAPVFGAIALMAGARWAPASSWLRPAMLFGGATLLLATLPMFLPALVATAARYVPDGAGPATQLAARRLRLRSRSLARPALMVAALVFASGSSYALYQESLRTEPEIARDVAKAYGVMSFNWRGEQPGDLDRVRSAVPGTVVAARAGEFTVSVPSCHHLDGVRSLVGEPCRGTALSPDAAHRFKQLVGQELVLNPKERADSADVVLLSEEPMQETELMRRFAGLPAINLSNGIQEHHGGVPGWVLLCWMGAMVTLGLGMTRELGDRVLLSRLENRGLWRVGLTLLEVRRVEIFSLGAPVVASLMVGWVAAVAFALVGFEIGITAGTVGGVTAASCLTGGGALVVFAVLVCRPMVDDERRD